MKAKIFAVAKEVKQREVSGRVVAEREIFLGFEREGFDGFVPRVRSGISKSTGKPFGMAVEGVDVAAFGNYVPKAGDIVNVECNLYGRIVGITKIS